MGPRNLLILFFSTVAVSLVILIIFFSLFFKSVDLNFNTKLPESAPDLGGLYDPNPSMRQESKADGILRSTVNVPPDINESTQTPKATDDEQPMEDPEPMDSSLPPISDDIVLDDPPKPKPKQEAPTPAPETEKSEAKAPRPVAPAPIAPPINKPAERPLEPVQLEPLVPPVPSQG